MKDNVSPTRAAAGPVPPAGDEVTSLPSGVTPQSAFRNPPSAGALRRGLGWLLGLVAGAGLAWAQGTAFSYQGQLTDGATAANGTYDLTFSLWNAATAGEQQGTTFTQSGVGVTNGLFTATLDFGAQFNGQNRWLEIAVRTNGVADFTTLAERQPVLPTPYAIHAANAGSAATATTATTVTGSVPASQLTGTLSAAQIPNLDASKITSGTFTGNGWGLTNVPLSALVQIDYTPVAWGDNGSGQATVPGGLNSVVAIAAGDSHSLALKADGTVVAWGSNGSGQRTVPAGLSGVVAIAAGGAHSLALKADIARPATLARLDQFNVFRGTVSALGFFGDGSGLTSLNASALSSGTVPVARVPDLDAAKITTGTLADARLSANVARLDGSPVFSSDVRLGDHDLYLRGGTDSNHGLGWFGGGGRTFAGATVDGPVLYGFLGGALGSTKTAQRIALSWNDGADVTLGGDLTITNTLSVSSPAGTRAASFTAARTGGHSSSVVQVENTSTSGTASPALRVMGRGASVDGALSVLADSGTIARFRNATDWVAAMDNAGNFAATSFVTLSDRTKKAGFAPVDVEAVLAKVAALPLTTWHYTNDAAATPHLGPMAQDFHAAFGLGGDDKTITTVDADGVALAAIQGLHHRTTALAAENAVIREELARQQTANADLRDELGELRSLVRQLQQQLNANRP
jgi:hypothetical protein